MAMQVLVTSRHVADEPVRPSLSQLVFSRSASKLAPMRESVASDVTFCRIQPQASPPLVHRQMGDAVAGFEQKHGLAD
jgi:hypothetical protein